MTVHNYYKCLTEVKGWLANYFLQLNEDKTEFIIFGNKKLEKDPVESYGLLSNNMHGDVKNLGVIFNSEIHFDHQVNSVVKTSYFQLRKLSKLKSILILKPQMRIFSVTLTYTDSYRCVCSIMQK